MTESDRQEPCHGCERNKAGRPTWGPGPWQGEPDYVPAFEHAGLPCILHRGNSAWCGYIAVPPGHPCHGLDCDEAHDRFPDLDVHGGLTYAERCSGHVCHVAKPGEPDDVWWFGWDAAHAGDLTPNLGDFYAEHHELFGREHYWTLDEARAETLRLAEQLAEIGAGVRNVV